MSDEKDNTISKGFKFALGVVLFLVIFFWLFKPRMVVGPMDSEGNIIVPKGSTKDVVYSSVPLKESNDFPQYHTQDTNRKKCPSSCDDGEVCTKDECSSLTNFECVYEKLTPCCGNKICEQKETFSNCKTDCKEDVLNASLQIKYDKNFMLTTVGANNIILTNNGNVLLNDYSFVKKIYRDEMLFCESQGTNFFTEELSEGEETELFMFFPKCDPFDNSGRVKMTTGKYLWVFEFYKGNKLITQSKYISEIEVINSGMGLLVTSIEKE